MDTKYCRGYCGAACIDGSCPIANAEERAERCMPLLDTCEECWYYQGCEDCAFEHEGYCKYYEKHINE